eukprot:1206100-Amorphochlora_amoeboformis.AAC.1
MDVRHGTYVRHGRSSRYVRTPIPRNVRTPIPRYVRTPIPRYVRTPRYVLYQAMSTRRTARLTSRCNCTMSQVSTMQLII